MTEKDLTREQDIDGEAKGYPVGRWPSYTNLCEIVHSAVNNYIQYLSEQRGEKPCLTCPYAQSSRGACFSHGEVVTHASDCGRWQRYEGQQAGLAKGLQMVKKREQEIAAQLLQIPEETLQETWRDYESRWSKGSLTTSQLFIFAFKAVLESWLGRE